MSEILIVVALGVIALGAIAYPLIAGRPKYEDRQALDTELDRYRRAVASKTVCPRCRLANREGSRFCGECGTRLHRG